MSALNLKRLQGACIIALIVGTTTAVVLYLKGSAVTVPPTNSAASPAVPVTSLDIPYIVQLFLVIPVLFLVFAAVATLYRKWKDHETLSDAFGKEIATFSSGIRLGIYFLLAFGFAHAMVVSLPDDGPVVEGLRSARSAVFSQSTRESAEQHTNLVLYGEAKPKHPSLWPSDPKITITEEVETTENVFLRAFDWRRLQSWFFFLALIAFVFEVWEEILVGCGTGLEICIEQINKYQARREVEEKAKAANPPAAAPVPVAPAASPAKNVVATAPAKKNEAQASATAAETTIKATATPAEGNNPPTATAVATIHQPTSETLPKGYLATVFGSTVLAGVIFEILPLVVRGGVHAALDHHEEKTQRKARLQTA